MFPKIFICLLFAFLIHGCNSSNRDPILEKNDEIFQKIKNKEEKILSDAKALINSGKKEEAYAKLNWYLGVQNHRKDISPEIVSLHSQLTKEPEVHIIIAKIEQEKLITEQNIKIEKELALRKSKFEKQLLALHGKKPWKMPWKEYYSNVQEFLSDLENDPSSIQNLKCSEPNLDLNYGWIVNCNYRSKNLFNALQKREAKLVITNSKVFEFFRLSQVPFKQRLELIKAKN